MTPIIVTTTCGTADQAQALAADLLNRRLVACVQISGPIVSSYWWKDRITTDDEFLLVMKSLRPLFDTLVQRISAVHPYDVPEIVATDITGISDSYRDWLIDQLDVIHNG